MTQPTLDALTSRLREAIAAWSKSERDYGIHVVSAAEALCNFLNRKGGDADRPAESFAGYHTTQPPPVADPAAGAEPMSTLEMLGATVDVLGSYRRGIKVGRELIIHEVIDWMVEHDYPVGELDELSVLLDELERMAPEKGAAAAYKDSVHGQVEAMSDPVLPAAPATLSAGQLRHLLDVVSRCQNFYDFERLLKCELHVAARIDGGGR